ncbi:glycoside hydrolase family 16 protein [Herbiconiux sp. L3-i23]|uniref:glycoside hydrolase family 16 protein n=1 Tax=Herbiconiux sp. L3-i23 TaxID=2905871 RepID=UPI0020492256|nr:glycoside hydrolase family 16 protein [Herbiconiux sp. L3-i23]BDI22279.1 hypothetical protein L3i23_10550 [Herbiconiux sp. L3-i23]
MSRAHRAAPDARRRNVVAAAAIVAVLGALTAAGVSYDGGAQLCGPDGAHCVALPTDRDGRDVGDRVEIIPLSETGRLTVSNRATDAERTVGVLGYLDRAATDPDVSYIPVPTSAPRTSTGIGRWGSSDAALPASAAGADAVIVRLTDDDTVAGAGPDGLTVDFAPSAAAATSDELFGAMSRLASSMGEDAPTAAQARSLWRTMRHATPAIPDPEPAPPATPAPAPTETAVPPADAAPPPVTGGGSEAAPQGDLPEWRQLLVEDFTRDAPLGTFASRYPGFASYDGSLDTSAREGRPQGQAGLYSSSTTTTAHDGLFDCYLHTRGVTPQVCALTPSLDGGWWEGQMYGRYSVRFKTDYLPGYKIAWLLWPSSDDWSDGEIDFPETELDGTIKGASHDVFGSPQDNAYYVDTEQTTQSWHTATIEWRPGSLTFILDGQSWTTTDPSALPTKPMRWTLQTETHLIAPAPAPEVAGHVYIDWIAAYAYSG